MFQWLNTLDSKEIYNQVISHLPDLELLTRDSFQVHTLKRTFQLSGPDQYSAVLLTRSPVHGM